MGVRNLTNVPAQALTLMNGQITKQSAIQWSQRLMGIPQLKTDEERIQAIFKQAYSREARPEELAACLSYLAGDADDPLFQITHAILNSKELIYVH